ncbi:hypothetical protein [Priestia megaterium]|uniref:hypothetical protein n=1 Tax=Priestia megaterium TaxID=1404 RepID=UPI00129410FC|nr:hypothetical protein [Priestia megaterium]MQR86405.1 hypothetical protein [Priestia megaterium]
MKFYKHVLIPLATGFLSFLCFIIYSEIFGDKNLEISNSLFISIGIFLGAIPVSFFVDYQKNKDKRDFNNKI